MSVNPTLDPAGAAAARAEQQRARAVRRAFARSADSAFVRTMQAAMGQYLEARTAGVSRDDAIRGLEEELRGCWPKGVSKFRPACDACDDTGYVDRVCWDRHRCGREVCAKNPDRTHSSVEVCHCPKGETHRRRTRTGVDELASAGKVGKKRGGFSPVGR